MSLLKLLQTLISGTHNPELDAARINHDSLPQSEYFQGEKLSKDQLERDKQITSQRGYQLGRSLRAAIEEHYSAPEQQRVIDNLMKAIDTLVITPGYFLIWTMRIFGTQITMI